MKTCERQRDVKKGGVRGEKRERERSRNVWIDKETDTQIKG